MNRKVLNFILIAFPLLAIGGLFFYLQNLHQSLMDIVNKEKKPLTYQDNTIQCPQCHMFLVGVKSTAQIVTKEGKTYFFDDVGCAILWLGEKKIASNEVTFWVYENEKNRYIDALRAFYSIAEDTPMHYGFGAHEQNGEGMIGFDEMRLRMLRGENMSDPKIRKKLLGS